MIFSACSLARRRLPVSSGRPTAVPPASYQMLRGVPERKTTRSGRFSSFTLRLAVSVTVRGKESPDRLIEPASAGLAEGVSGALVAELHAAARLSTASNKRLRQRRSTGLVLSGTGLVQVLGNKSRRVCW